MIIVWLQFFFASSLFICNCFAERFLIPEMKSNERVRLDVLFCFQSTKILETLFCSLLYQNLMQVFSLECFIVG